MSKYNVDDLYEMDLEIPRKFERREKDANDKKTYDEVFDRATLMVIYKLISEKVITNVDYPISTGKEANIFKGTSPDGLPVALKIYRLATSTFKNLIRYIDGDPRFKNIRRDHRSLIYAWAKKEYKNLEKMAENNVRVPKPITVKKNILVMEFIGETDLPAPELRLVKLKQPAKQLKVILNYVKRLYIDANMVHGDLSEYNVLVQNNEIVLIDVGQSLLMDHPIAKDLLINDIKNIINYFKRVYGLKSDPEKITNDILKLKEDS